MSDLLESPLHSRHVALGAKFGPFGGWAMPLDYGSVVAEHKAVRDGVGVFDVSHLGTFDVSGPGTIDFLNTCVTNDLAKIADGQAQYNLVCNEDGGVIDDIIVYRWSEDHALVMPNAANAATVIAALTKVAPAGITIVDQHRDIAVLAVQGTTSDEVCAALGFPVGHDYMHFAVGDFHGTQVIVCRTGYTGERGYELLVPAAIAGEVWDALMVAGEPFGIRACGLGARDTLRTEMGYPLHGQDLAPSISAIESGAGWAIAWDKPTFWGAEALRAAKAAGPSRRIRGLVATGRGIPRPHMSVVGTDGEVLGEVTSGTFSPTLGKGIALALLRTGIPEGTAVAVEVRGRQEPFEVRKPPFVTPGVREG